MNFRYERIVIKAKARKFSRKIQIFPRGLDLQSGTKQKEYPHMRSYQAKYETDDWLPQIFQLFIARQQINNKQLQFMNRKKEKPVHQSSDQNYVIYTETNVKRKPMKKKSKGAWSIKENQLYLQFLRKNKDLFGTQFVRRSQKVFRKIARVLRKRNPEQCRSHHQKFQVKHGNNIDEIITQLQAKIQQDKKIRDLKAEILEKEAPIDEECNKEVNVKVENMGTNDDERRGQLKKLKDCKEYCISRGPSQEFFIKVLKWQMEFEL